MSNIVTTTRTEQEPTQPGIESEMQPKPKANDKSYKGSGKLKNRTAVISGGDSGIGRAVAIFFAREGADIAVAYFNEHGDAQETKRLVEAEGRKCVVIAADIGEFPQCKQAIGQVISDLGKIDILVNNAAQQILQENFLAITPEQLERTFRTNIFGYFYLTQATLPHLRQGSAIINTTSVTAYRGSQHLIDYSATKGAVVSFTRSLAKNLAEEKIRVNAVAPGPVWTPLIPSSFNDEKVKNFGQNVPLGRPGQPEEIAPSFVFLASDDSSYMTGQVLHPNGGEIVNG